MVLDKDDYPAISSYDIGERMGWDTWGDECFKAVELEYANLLADGGGA